jgi:hypothetical protein
LCLGDSVDNINNDIFAIKQVESDRLVSFRESNPNMFLPTDLEDIVSSSMPYLDGLDNISHDRENISEDSPWIEVASKKGSRKRKLIFRSNGSRPYMEYKRS